MASTPSVPSFHLLCMQEAHTTAFRAAAKKYNLPSSINITYHNTYLNDLSSATHFDAIVSPANSYGRLDGGFDDALSRAFAPKQDYHALTRVAQRELWTQWRGFAPPGTCTLIDLAVPELVKNAKGWGCGYLLLCPTMRVPMDVDWDCDVIYECIYSLLTCIDKHNRKVEEEGGRGRKIETVLMTPLATGYGKWTADRWAAQAVIAMKRWVSAGELVGGDGQVGWEGIFGVHQELEGTYKL